MWNERIVEAGERMFVSRVVRDAAGAVLAVGASMELPYTGEFKGFGRAQTLPEGAVIKRMTAGSVHDEIEYLIVSLPEGAVDAALLRTRPTLGGF